MTARLRAFAPAKVNLFLEVLARRPDGYHEVETVLQALDFGDELSVAVRPRRPGEGAVALRCEPPVTERPEENLAYRAAQALVDPEGPRRVEIVLRKRVPAGAGLGGGASDAAAVLRLTARCVGYHGDLRPLAARLGADVPFFLAGGTAVARGIGERLTPLQPAARFTYVLALPPHAVRTAEAYRHVDLTGPRRTSSVLVAALEAGDAAGVEREIFNRLEGSTLGHRRELAALKGRLEAAGGVPFHLTGSGAAFFALCVGGEGAAEELMGRLQAALPTVRFHIARSLTGREP